MRNFSYVLLGFLLVLLLGGGVLYWTTMTPEDQVSQAEAVPAASSQDAVKSTSANSALADSTLAQSAPTQSNLDEAPSSLLDAALKSADATAPDTAIGETGQATETDNIKPDAMAQPVPKAEAADTIVPQFDILRVEPDGSVVIAGRAAPDSKVDVIAGSRLLGSSKAGTNGDFAIVLDRALNGGDHQLVLRATVADSNVATSSQTAIVSVPANSDGQVLALVEEPGQASRLITRPEPASEPQEIHKTPDATTNSAERGSRVVTKNNPVGPVTTSADVPISIEAVEIEGQKVFVAGSAHGAKGPQNTVSVKANDIVLGVSPVTPEGRFLIQSQQPLAVGDYIIRADLLDSAGRVIGTARVPFRRVAGENLSAVATATNQQSQEPADGGTPEELQKVDGSVIIRRGDNLWTISKRTYGHGLRYTTIYLANRDQIKNPDLIWPGQVFVMPQEPLPEAEVKRQLNTTQN